MESSTWPTTISNTLPVSLVVERSGQPLPGGVSSILPYSWPAPRFFSNSLESFRREEGRNFEIFVPIVERLSRFYKIPPPTVAPLGPEHSSRGRLGGYDLLLHEIRLSPSLPPAVLIRTLPHECHHAYQASLMAAAVVRDVENGVSVREALAQFPQPIVDDVYASGKHEDPSLVAIGRILGESSRRVVAAQRYGATTTDTDEYLRMQSLYRNSFEELCVKIVELEVAVWQAEEELHAAEDLSTQRSRKLHKLGWFGEAAFAIVSRGLARRCNGWRIR